MQNIRSVGVMVTYNPDFDTYKVIKELVAQSIYLIVIDNGSKESSIVISLEELKDNVDNLKIIRNDKNIGLAAAQNKGILYADNMDFDYLFFFDQDTLIPKNFVVSMEAAYEKYQTENNYKLGILAPNYKDKNIKDFAHYARLTEKGYEDIILNNSEYKKVSFVISSGSMMSMDLIKKIGLLRDDFFIDQIDTEYSLRVLSCGYDIVATSNALLEHTIGNREKKHFLFLTIKPNHHNSLRKYYIFRNGQYLKKIYGKDYPGFIVLMNHRFIHDLIGVVFFENEKLSKLKSIFKGYKDGNIMFKKEQSN